MNAHETIGGAEFPFLSPLPYLGGTRCGLTHSGAQCTHKVRRILSPMERVRVSGNDGSTATECRTSKRHFRKLICLLIGLLLLPLALPGAETAQARLFCLSVRFQQGTFSSGFGDVTLDLSTIGLGAPNGELAPTFSQPDHVSEFHLFNTTIEDTIEDGILNLNVPAFTDSNTNGFPDFFEVSQAISGVSTGLYSSSPVDSGTIRATWNRSAGSKDGTCLLSLTSKTFGPLGDFTHTFELLEYAGTLNYTPTATNVSGTLDLTKSGDSSSKLPGPFSFLKSATNRFNALDLQPGVWTNSAGQSLSYTNDFFQRDPSMP